MPSRRLVLLGFLITSQLAGSEPRWSITVRETHDAGQSSQGGAIYTLDCEGKVDSVRYQNGVAGPQPFHVESRVAHPERLPELEKALRDPTLGGLGQAPGPNLEWDIRLGGQALQLKFAHPPGKALPGAAARVQAALDRVLGAGEPARALPPERWRLSIHQLADAPGKAQGWEERELSLTSQGRAQWIYYKVNSDIEGRWLVQGPKVDERLLGQIENVLFKMAPAENTPGQVAPVTGYFSAGERSGRFFGLGPPLEGLLQKAFQAPGPLLRSPWKKRT